MSRPIKPITYQFEHCVKQTEGQVKKHHTQFTPTEQAILKVSVDAMNPEMLKLPSHALNHIGFLNLNLVKQVLVNYEIIEFNVTNKYGFDSCRVLVRSNKTLQIMSDGVTSKANICLVIDIATLTVITAYINCQEDLHRTLNMNRYDGSLNVLQYAMRA